MKSTPIEVLCAEGATRWPGWRSVVCLVAFLAWSTAALAQQGAAGTAQCASRSTILPRERIAKCTALLGSLDLSTENRVAAYTNRGMAYRENHQLELAIADYSEAIRLESTYTAALVNRGIAYRDRGDYDLAIND